MENEQNVAEDESILASIDDSYTYNDSDDGYISMNDVEEIQDGSYAYSYINTIDARLKIRDHIKQPQNEWKESELLANSMGKVLHKFFKAVVK